MVIKRMPSWLYAILASLIVVILCLIYLYFIGIPRTQARSLYNESLRLQEIGLYEHASNALSEGLSFWEEGYIRAELNRVNALLDISN